jgi:hypothetical protein
MVLYLAMLVGLVAFHPGSDVHGYPLRSPESERSRIPVSDTGEHRGDTGFSLLLATPKAVCAALGPPNVRGGVYRWRYGAFAVSCRVRAGFVTTAKFTGHFDRDSLADLVRAQIGDDSAQRIGGDWVTKSGVRIQFSPRMATFSAASSSVLSLCDKR